MGHKKNKKKKGIELIESRAIVNLPYNTIEIEVSCKLPDGHGGFLDVRKKLSADDVWEAFNKADVNYILYDDQPHLTPSTEDDECAMICLPNDAVFVCFACKCTNHRDGGLVNVDRTLTLTEIRQAFRYADIGYMEDDDRFVLTEKGRAALEKIMADEKKELPE